MLDYVDVSVDVVSGDDWRYHIQANVDIPECVDILYQERQEDNSWLTVTALEMISMPLLKRIMHGAEIVHENSYSVLNILD